MGSRNIFGYILILAVLCTAAYWFLARPSPQERILESFFDELRRGDVDDADDYLLNNSYGQFIKKSNVIDSDGKDLKEGIHGWGVDENRLEELARSHIPLIRFQVPKLEVESSELQKEISNRNKSHVKFKIIFNIKEIIDQPSIPGSCEGTAHFVRVNNKWLIENGDFHFNIQGRTLKDYAALY